jgi:hypothetical protein
MGEVKRIFNQAKIDRDTDARMVQPGFHRDALNVSVGESEGGDVGAVENLKGNEEISGQADVEGTTIGSIVDPNNDRVYWFNTSSVFDAIYEYDKTTNAITTILRDPKARTATLPTCSPTLQARITDPVSGRNNRPSPDPLPSNPLPGCTDPTATNYSSTAEYDNGSCTYGPSISVTISGDGSFYNSSSPVTLTANVANANGAFTYLWNTGETTQTISISGSNTTITGSTPGVTVTDSSGASATDDYSVTFSAAPTTLGVSLSNPGDQINGASVLVTSNVTNALGSITYSWTGGGGSSANSTYTGSNTTIQRTLTVTDSGRTTPNDQASATRAVQFNAVQSFDFVGTTADNTGANISAAGGQSFYNRTSSETISFSSAASLASNYEWVVAPTVSVSGLPSGVTASGISGGGQGTTLPASVAISGNWSGTSDASPTITWNGGSAQVIPAAQHTLNITNGSSGLGSNITTSVASYSVTKNVGTTTGVTFNASCTPASGYEWVTLPSASSSSLPSGVTLTSTTGSPVGGTGARQVSATGNWSPTSAGTTNASVTWSGGSVQVVPPACNNYQITYSGNNGQLNYTNCTTGNAGTYNLSNSSGTNVITMQSQTFPTQGSGSGYTIYNISQI